MGRAFALVLLVGCNQLIGVHDYAPDAAIDAAGQCTIDSDCTDPHAVCLNHSTCACSAGYALGATSCVWVGVVDDPGFERQPDLWMASTNALFEPNAPQGAGMEDPGDVRLGLDSTCRGSSVTQQITMPRYARSQQLVLSTTYSSSFGFSSLTPVIGIGPVWYRNVFPYFGATAQRTCLGAGHYAPDASTGLGETVPFVAEGEHILGGVTCPQSPNEVLVLDHVEVLPAAPGECPLPGQVLNGDAEIAGGWTFTGSGASTGDLEPCAAPASAPATGNCARLRAKARCDTVTARIAVSAPLAEATGSPALHVYYAANPGVGLSLQVDTSQSLLMNALALDSDGPHSYCLPAYMRGGVYTLQATVSPPASPGKCGDPIDLSAYLDNIAIDNMGACGTDPYVADPGFESFGGGYSLIGASSASGVLDTANAHSGSAFLRLSASCFADYTTWVSTPPAPDSAGPALHFFYRYTSGTANTTFATSLNGKAAATIALAPSAQWQEKTICLDRHQTGWPQSVEFRLQTSGVLACPTDTLDIDDLSATTSMQCP